MIVSKQNRRKALTQARVTGSSTFPKPFPVRDIVSGLDRLANPLDEVSRDSNLFNINRIASDPYLSALHTSRRDFRTNKPIPRSTLPGVFYKPTSENLSKADVFSRTAMPKSVSHIATPPNLLGAEFSKIQGDRIIQGDISHNVIDSNWHIPTNERSLPQTDTIPYTKTGKIAQGAKSAAKSGLKYLLLGTPTRMALGGLGGFAYGAATSRQHSATAQAKDAFFAGGIGVAAMAATSPLLWKGISKAGKAVGKASYNWMKKPYTQASNAVQIEGYKKMIGANAIPEHVIQGRATTAGLKNLAIKRGLPILTAGLAIAGLTWFGNKYSQRIAPRNLPEGVSSTGFGVMETGVPRVHVRGPFEASTDGLVQGLSRGRHG